MDDLQIQKLRIYAMLQRLNELQKEKTVIIAGRGSGNTRRKLILMCAAIGIGDTHGLFGISRIPEPDALDYNKFPNTKDFKTIVEKMASKKFEESIELKLRFQSKDLLASSLKYQEPNSKYIGKPQRNYKKR